MNTIYLYADDPPEMQKKPLPHKKKGRGKLYALRGVSRHLPPEKSSAAVKERTRKSECEASRRGTAALAQAMNGVEN